MNTPVLQIKLWTLKAYETGCPNRDLGTAVCINLRIPNLDGNNDFVEFQENSHFKISFLFLFNSKTGQFQDISNFLK